MGRMSLTENSPAHLIVGITQNTPTVITRKTPRMKLLPILRLQILPLNALITCFAQTTIEFVVVLLAVGVVGVDVEIGRWKG